MHEDVSRQVLSLGARQGRRYELPTMTAVFKADEGETDARYSISEWWLKPGCPGVGAHLHEDNDEIFYVLAGRPDLLVGDVRRRCEGGAFLRIPAGTLHDFRNETGEEAGLLNVFLPGGFERQMPAIVDWFARNGR